MQQPSNSLATGFWMSLAAVIVFAAMLGSVAARSYDATDTPYTDVEKFDAETAVAVSVLTDEDVVRGNPDGTFRPRDLLNRAEFLTIVTRLMGDPESFQGSTNCFPDVAAEAWYAKAVCWAKQLDIVRGNADATKPMSQWRFEPTRTVQYEEAVKILVGMYAVSFNGETEGADWYQPYIDAAQREHVALEGLRPGDKMSRADMAKLSARFLAHSMDELDAYEDAVHHEADVQNGTASSSRSSRVSSSSSSSLSSGSSRSGSSRSASSTSRSSVASGDLDPLPATSLREHLLLLGRTSPVMASVAIFSNAEPIIVTDLSVNIDAQTDSIDHFLLYDENRRFLGRATLDTSVSGRTRYTLSLRTQNMLVPRREEFTVYARAVVLAENAGGESGDVVNVASIRIVGDGDWSNRAYTQTSSEDFPSFQTSRGLISKVENAGDTEGPLLDGQDTEIGSFRFTGEEGDSGADIAVTALTFQIERSGTVNLSNVDIGADATSARSSCTTTSTTITCSSLPAELGSLEDRPRTLTLYADIDVVSDDASLRITLNAPGTVSDDGSVAWTDGDTTFTWLPVDTPVARSTYFSI